MNTNQETLIDHLLDIGKNTIARSLWKIRREVTTGRAGQPVQTSADKFAAGDPTTFVDIETEKGILEYLESKLQAELQLPCIISTEEEGIIRFLAFGEPSEIDLVVFVDPVDFTESVVRGLDGSSLITFYSIRSGTILAAVVGDVRDQKVYFASESCDGAYSQFVEHVIPPENATLERIPDDYQYRFIGDCKQLRPSTLKDLSKAHINCLLNKPERMESLLKRKRLVEAMEEGGRFYVVGGSLGLARVAAGILDGAVEFAKGFREWDAWPGIYICKKAGVFVRDLRGNQINCNLKTTSSEVRGRLEHPERQPFIATGSVALGQTLVAMKLYEEG